MLLEGKRTCRAKLQNAAVLQQLIYNGILSELNVTVVIVESEEQRGALARVARALRQKPITSYHVMQPEVSANNIIRN